jgi:heavy metal sensor kinase
MFETVRSRLTLWYVSVLAAALIAVTGFIYVLLARALYLRIDDNLHASVEVAMISLSNDLEERQDIENAARATAAELDSNQQMLAIYDEAGRLLAEEGRAKDLEITLPPIETIPTSEALLVTVAAGGQPNSRHRLAVRRATIEPGSVRYIIVVGSPLAPIDERLASLRVIVGYVIPIALGIAGLGGWFLVRHSLSPVVAMADRARKIGVGNLNQRLPVANRRDELGHLAETFNELLGRLEASLTQQRQFMADASHELRTPLATARTAAAVTLQQSHRDEREYRQMLEIIERQTMRLSRIVEDMFTLARADAGNYPIRKRPMYLDELVDEVVAAARVLASTKNVTIELDAARGAQFEGDEDLIRRLILNLLDNSIRHTPTGSTLRVGLERTSHAYAIAISDQGPGIPVEIQPHIFDRFYRGDAARTRGDHSDGGAGLGLALARWIAAAHQGEVTLARSSAAGTTFAISLPYGHSPGQ